jgi:hypothetical protein
MAVAMSALQGLNAVRTLADPSGFALYMGLPIESERLANWVQVYGLRAAFIAILTAVLLARKDFAALRWTALAAVIMPLGDAWLTYNASAPAAVVGRHLIITAFLIAAVFFLTRAARQKADGKKSK